MSTIFLILQCGLVGFMAGVIYPNYEWQFWAVIAANAVFVTAYGTFRAMKY
jgi:hypothetical protein